MERKLHNSNIFRTFEGWIGGSCKPSDKGKLTAFPRFKICQHKRINVSTMLRFEDLPEINSPRWLSLEDLEGEEWKDVVGYEEFFQISNYGRFKRKERYSYNSHNGYCRYGEKIIRNQNKRYGYQRLNVCAGVNNNINFDIHRLVALAFIPNPYCLPYINHKDENPSNNCVYNLEWCTPKYNSNYGTLNARQRENRILKGTTRKVVLYDYEGNELNRYDTIRDASKDNGISEELISQCCEGKISSANGLHFRYEDDKYEKRILKQIKNTYSVYKDNKLLFQTKETKELCRNIGVSYYSFRTFLKYGGKSCSGLQNYLIIIDTQEGKHIKIEHGVKYNIERSNTYGKECKNQG